MKTGKITETLFNLTKPLKGLLNKKKGSHGDLVDRYTRQLHGYIQMFKFAYTFIVEDYSDLAIAQKMLDRFSMPDDFKKIERLNLFEKFIGHLFSAHINEDIRKKLRRFSDVEIFRLDEALITLKNEAYLSSIVMSVSSAENRLHQMVKTQLPGIYKKDKLDRAPLGSLLDAIDTNKKYKKFKATLSEKFPSLLTMCNRYRIFSAHPKQEIMNYQDALAVFSSVMSFLVSANLK